MPEAAGLQAEIVRLNKVIKALMNRSVRSASGQASEYGRFHSAITLESRIASRTADLQAALRENEKIERSLRESEALFKGLVNQSLVGIVIIENGVFTYSNARFDEMFGYTAAEVVGIAPIDTAVESDRPKIAENLRKRLVGQLAQVEYEFRGLRKDGGVLDVECHSSALLSGGRMLVVSLVLDITERKRADEALRASLQDKEALLKETHHRVKNNLALISSLMRLEAGRSHEPETKTALNEMQTRISSVALLNQTLYQAGNYGRVNLSEYLKQIATHVFRAQNADSGAVRLNLDLEPVEVQTAQAMPCGLILNELMTNSLKHAFPGGRSGEVQIRLRQSAGVVRLDVSDTGVGLPEDFSIRQQNSLGMQLVTDLTRQLQGELKVGPGAAFTISFSPTPDAI